MEPYSGYHFPAPAQATSSSYAPSPFADMTAATNLFPQALRVHTTQAPASTSLDLDSDLELSLPYDTTPMANYDNLNDSDLSLKITGNVDYHASDHIFDSFNATFGSPDGTY